MIQQPLSILYFDGGVKGRWAASLFVIGYLLYDLIKRKMSLLRVAEAAAIYLLSGLTVYFLGLSWFIPEQKLSFLATSALSILAVLSFLLAKGRILWTGFVERRKGTLDGTICSQMTYNNCWNALGQPLRCGFNVINIFFNSLLST